MKKYFVFAAVLALSGCSLNPALITLPNFGGFLEGSIVEETEDDGDFCENLPPWKREACLQPVAVEAE